MRKRSVAAVALILAGLTQTAMANILASPDGRIIVTFERTPAGELTYAVSLNDHVVLEPSPLGIATTCGAWLRNLEITDCTSSETIHTDYRLLHGKRRECHYTANRCIVLARNADGLTLRIVFQVSNDGVAFRYELPACGENKAATVQREATGFDFPLQSRAWLLPMDEGHSGWSSVHPCYERFYEVDVPVTAQSPTSTGWACPALFHVRDDAWALVAESNVTGNYCGSRLSSPTDGGLYVITFPDPKENNGAGSAAPEIALPFVSPWRVVILGETLKPLVESTLIEDLADPSRLAEAPYVKPGRATWSWLREKDPATIFDRQKDYVDLAAKLGFEYCLVDALWDVQIGYEKIGELVKYAASRGVGILVWYNSNGDWNDAPQSPKDRMHTHAVRMEEFKRLRELGVKGVKIDFFGGDKQTTMQLYLDTLADAAQFDMLVNFHGATIPRGWDRTWPNLMSMEGVRGYEFFTFSQEGADQAPAHACMVPFIRNVIGPMDFTPTCLGRYLDSEHKVERRTSDAFDLAMAVVYESGIQHFGVTPDDIAGAPAIVLDYLRALPATWDEIRFLDGFPNRYVVIARRAGDRWFVGGINGQDRPQPVDCDLGFIGQSPKGVLIEDGKAGEGLKAGAVEGADAARLKLTIPAHGGFVFRSVPE
ncbi:MAG TPA: glycoside hydrolase family 97 catalytic domain-containing protein [Phycisphaerae bacterium]|nr:glycoside hydrolase family 97 catalytic domain-containing protein [Phycisphaerae bacterium]